jgi:hypothetical protein
VNTRRALHAVPMGTRRCGVLVQLLLATGAAAQAGVWQEKGIPGITTQSVFNSILVSPCVPSDASDALLRYQRCMMQPLPAPKPRWDAANGLGTRGRFHLA